MNSALPKRVSIPSEVIFQEIENDCVLLNMASEHYFGLNDVGTRMWKMLIEDGDPQAALAQLQSYYEVDEATLRHDLTGFIKMLETKALLTVG